MKKHLSWSKQGRKCWEWKEAEQKNQVWALGTARMLGLYWLLRWYHTSAIWGHWDSPKEIFTRLSVKKTFLINLAKWLTLPRLRTLHAVNAVTHFSWVEGSFISCGYQFQTSKGSGGSEKHPAVQMLVWTAWACTTGPAVLPERRILWDSRRFLDLHGPELPQEPRFLCWLWHDCFHPDPGRAKDV